MGQVRRARLRADHDARRRRRGRLRDLRVDTAHRRRRRASARKGAVRDGRRPRARTGDVGSSGRRARGTASSTQQPRWPGSDNPRRPFIPSSSASRSSASSSKASAGSGRAPAWTCASGGSDAVTRCAAIPNASRSPLYSRAPTDAGFTIRLVLAAPGLADVDLAGDVRQVGATPRARRTPRPSPAAPRRRRTPRRTDVGSLGGDESPLRRSPGSGAASAARPPARERRTA